MTVRQFFSAVLGLWCLSSVTSMAAAELPEGVACLLEENGAELLPQLTNPGGDLGDGEVEKDVVFSGQSGIKITNYQRYFNLLPGWAYRITENPKQGEYRFLRFAWKSQGLTGIMLQLHDDRDWHIRYNAGANKFGWESKQIAETPPHEWTTVTVDLFKDFGEREIHGIALTAFDGMAGYFDHIYLGRTVADLDLIDSTGLSKDAALALSTEEVEKHWTQLSSPDASVAYRSYWTLAAAGESAQAMLQAKVNGEVATVDDARIAEWLKQLDHDEYSVREQASTQLTRYAFAARTAMDRELQRTTSIEVRRRLETVLAKAAKPATEAEQTEQQVRRILQIIAERRSRSR